MPKFNALSDKVSALLRQAVRTAGSFKPEDTIYQFEEQLTFDECDQVMGFLTWLNEKGKTFGHNIDSVYQEFMDDNGAEYIQNAANA